MSAALLQEVSSASGEGGGGGTLAAAPEQPAAVPLAGADGGSGEPSSGEAAAAAAAAAPALDSRAVLAAVSKLLEGDQEVAKLEALQWVRRPRPSHRHCLLPMPLRALCTASGEPLWQGSQARAALV